jgi:hypothetical protein
MAGVTRPKKRPPTVDPNARSVRRTGPACLMLGRIRPSGRYSFVMPGLVPEIHENGHDFCRNPVMVGTSPAMTG